MLLDHTLYPFSIAKISKSSDEFSCSPMMIGRTAMTVLTEIEIMFQLEPRKEWWKC